MVGGTILLLEYAVTLFSPHIEKSFFWGDDREELEVIQSLQDRMLTNRDLRQFLETTAALISDRLPVSSGFIAILDGENVDQVVTTGDKKKIEALKIDQEFILQAQQSLEHGENLIEWDGLYLLPLEYEFEENQSVCWVWVVL